MNPEVLKAVVKVVIANQELTQAIEDLRELINQQILKGDK
jgi:UDP:flavonoid glycosyltransferase YjiC (YdhE family)